MRQDYESPIKEEVLVGMPATLASEITTLAYASTHFPPEVAVPMLAGHFALLATMSSFRKAFSNWTGRSRAWPENVLKQGMVGMLFILNYNVVAKWPRIAAGMGHEGAARYLAENLPSGLMDFAVQQGPTVAMQTVFFTVTFANGLFNWELMTSVTPERSRAARRTAAVIAPAIFWLSGPVLTWASTSQNILFHLGPLALNDGHAALAGLTLAGSALWLKPRLLDPMIGVVELLVYAPLARAQAALRQIAGFARGALARARGDSERRDEWAAQRLAARLPAAASCQEIFSAQ
jgi:hypothetical protein